MKQLYFIRHGQSIHNEIGRFSGILDSPLTEKGREEILLSSQEILKLNINIIVSSPLSRALDSAKIIADTLHYPYGNILVNDLFIERDLGELENTTYNPYLINDEIKGIETVEELIIRAKLALDWLYNISENNILLVSHGSFGKALKFVISQKLDFKHHETFDNAVIVKLI